MDKVIIVESPSKSKTISSYLGKGYTVLSSKGHICDLATSGKDGLGIDIDNGFLPTYKVMKEKESLVNTLIKACYGKQVFLATDPDREGEAIAFHLARCLGLSFNELNRVEFHEITKEAVTEALNNPHSINLKMVESQEARRMIDRILGFKLSKLLQRKIGSKSAGRVQSAALLLIVNLEKEIKEFIPTKYYEMEAEFNYFKSKLIEYKGQIIDSNHKITDKEVLIALKARLLSFTVENIINKQIKRNSMPTFTTSTMQQEASSKLGFSPSRTMRIAQGLYEGKKLGDETVGLITYMRTDSTRLADSFVVKAKNYILEHYGKKYVGTVKNKTQKGMQDAHEGIRPTSINRTPESVKQYLSDEEYKLYNLIYKRTLSSLMSAAVFNSTRVELRNVDSLWVTNGSELVFDGYLRVYGRSSEDENELLPPFELGKSYNANEINILEKETQPKSRYTEASLIKDMEEKGIGRPSTYAQTIYTLKEREYVKLEKKTLIPTEQGILTINKLLEYFDSMINVEYTAEMENNLDKIAHGLLDKLEELNNFYEHFKPVYDVAVKKMEAIYPIYIEELCPNCGKPLVIRLGKYGEFVACSNYPSCTYIKKEEPEVKPDDTGVICPNCKKAHLVKRIASKGKSKGKEFYACNNYPKCKTIYNDLPTNDVCPDCGALMLVGEEGMYCSNHCSENKQTEHNVLCPICKTGSLIKRVASKGKNKGNIFYGCSNFPKCKNIITEEEYEKIK